MSSDGSSDCSGKKSWPELVGSTGEVAKATIELENPKVKAVILPEGSIVTQEFDSTRVRVYVNPDGIVVVTPVIG